MTQPTATDNEPIEICDVPPGRQSLLEHARISIAFEVDRIFEVRDSVARHRRDRSGGLWLSERPVAVPYLKDYDALPGNQPAELASRYDLANWGLLWARVAGRPVGGALIAFNTRGVDMLEDRRDLAVLWDLRVAPEMRRAGVGAALFAATEQWAAQRGCRQLKVETQNVNVAACKFYASRGCRLGACNRFAYLDQPEEVQLLWYKDLSRGGRR